MRAVVVGASSGLGRCIGVGLARRGAQVALMARRTDRLEDAVGQAGPGAMAIRCDVTDTDSVDTAIEKAAAELGGIDALVYTPARSPSWWTPMLRCGGESSP
jgi:NAD(P)-dependent dehydrogenase (short-subunit alcohol dehydrogenase family)